jgi:hypothetical protein
MIVDIGQLIRNASGDFGCPSCWPESMSIVTPRDERCPKCGVELEWPVESIRAHRHYTSKREILNVPTKA